TGLKEDRTQSIRGFFENGAKRGNYSVAETPVRTSDHGNKKDPILFTFDALVPDQMGEESVDTGGDKKGEGGNQINGIHNNAPDGGRATQESEKTFDVSLLLYARVPRIDQ